MSPKNWLVPLVLLLGMDCTFGGQTAGDPTEGFETNDFSKHPWVHAGDEDWSTTGREKHSGVYSAESGAITDDERSDLQVTLDCVTGNITFCRKVSSESGFDVLKFYIDGVEQGKWSGREDWTEVSFPVMEGTRTFEWTYSKDDSVSEGDDTAWIDDIVFPSRVQGAESSLVYGGADGHLVYGTYANEGQTNSVNTIPDFSHCGYMGGGVAIPDVPVATTLSPRNGDDTQMIQNAIDHVSSLNPDANGFRGAVLLTAGRYQVSSTLAIMADGVVLRGQGQDVLGTVLEATGAYGYNVIEVKGSGDFSAISSTIRSITSSYVPVGAHSFDIEGGGGRVSEYSVGDWIIVQRTTNQSWIDDLAMGQYGWRVDSYRHMYERHVVGVTGNTITIDSPMVEVIEDRYGSGRIFKSRPLYRLSQCGVENLRIESTYASDTDEDHPWNAVVLEDVEDCWVRRVTAQFFAGCCVNMGSDSTRVTIEDCAFLDPKSLITGGRRYAFMISPAANHILFQRCYAAYARHSYVTGHMIPGPNVFVDCYAYNCWLDSGPHHRWATGTLYDNIRDSLQINAQNNGPTGTGHGWTGAQQVLWNCRAGSIVCEAPKGAMNFAIGCSGTRKDGVRVDELWKMSPWLSSGLAASGPIWPTGRGSTPSRAVRSNRINLLMRFWRLARMRSLRLCRYQGQRYWNISGTNSQAAATSRSGTIQQRWPFSICRLRIKAGSSSAGSSPTRAPSSLAMQRFAAWIMICD
jgi:hypothetical protein